MEPEQYLRIFGSTRTAGRLPSNSWRWTIRHRMPLKTSCMLVPLNLQP